MHQCRSLKRLAGLLISSLDGREFAKFVVDQWQKPFGGGRITELDLRQICVTSDMKSSLERFSQTA